MVLTLGAALAEATEALKSNSQTPRLDAEILLQQTIQRDKALLYAHPERVLTNHEHTIWQQLLARRLAGEPIAYIQGHKEFWDLTLAVNPAALIPRPETELLVEWALTKLPTTPMAVVDLGCGSGAIALSLKKARPQWKVHAVEMSQPALMLAKQNAKQLDLTIEWHHGDWFAPLLGQRFAAIISNPPYVAQGDPHLLQGDVRFEPRQALVADMNGLAALQHICLTAPHYLLEHGWLLLEHGYQQAPAVQVLLQQKNFQQIETVSDYARQPRITVARANGLKTI